MAGIDGSRPLVLRGGLCTSWAPTSWSLDQWASVLTAARPLIAVRVGQSQPLLHPQWERSTREEIIEATRLFEPEYWKLLTEQGLWAYFDYKYMQELFSEEVLNEFRWDAVGLSCRDGRDSTLWIGTKGAHTPCHQDSYGYNLVAQLHGSKTWTLFPPDKGKALKPTRVPYEESSVYSSLNLQHPHTISQADRNELRLSSPHVVILQPGDVLYVPRGWWHHVTNNQFSISVNSWVESPRDEETRVEEALVRLQASMLAKTLPRAGRNLFLNPNEDNLVDINVEELADLCLELVQRLPNDLAPENFPDFTLLWENVLPASHFATGNTEPKRANSEPSNTYGEKTGSSCMFQTEVTETGNTSGDKTGSSNSSRTEVIESGNTGSDKTGPSNSSRIDTEVAESAIPGCGKTGSSSSSRPQLNIQTVCKLKSERPESFTYSSELSVLQSDPTPPVLKFLSVADSTLMIDPAIKETHSCRTSDQAEVKRRCLGLDEDHSQTGPNIKNRGSQSDSGGLGFKQFVDSPTVKIFKALTSETVIKAAVRELREQLSYASLGHS